MAKDNDFPERPRAEPEIIPPDRGGPRWVWPPHHDAGGSTHRIYITRLGPFGSGLLVLALLALAVVIVLAFVGALLIWIPILALIAIIAAVSGLLRFRGW